MIASLVAVAALCLHVAGVFAAMHAVMHTRTAQGAFAWVLGLVLFPLMAMLHTGVDILLSGVAAGTLAYGVHWWRRRA